MMMFLSKTVSNSRKGSGFTFFIPVLQPGIGADGMRILSHGSTLGLITRLLGADEPFIVSIPAMQGLILRGESFITRSGPNLLDHGKDSTLFLVHLGDGLRKDLLEYPTTKKKSMCVSKSNATKATFLFHQTRSSYICRGAKGSTYGA